VPGYIGDWEYISFKAQEIERMRLGGNKPWRDFFDDAEANKMAGIRSVLSSG
jgi:hypothetical protein